MEATGFRYTLFCLHHMWLGLWHTRRYRKVLWGNKRIRRLFYQRIIGSVVGGALWLILQTIYYVPLFLVGHRQGWYWLIGIFISLFTFFTAFLITASLWDGLLTRDHPWLKYRETWLKATMRSMFEPMGLRVRLNRIEDTDMHVDRTYALFDWNEYGGNLYLPQQSRYVLNILMSSLYSTDPYQYDLLSYYRATFNTPGMAVLMQRAYLFKKFMKNKTSAQPGFGGMVLQRGADAFMLHNEVSADQYADLSFYGVATKDMCTAKNTPFFLLKEVYAPDPQVMDKLKNSTRLDDPAWWINYYMTSAIEYKVRLRGHMIVEHKRFAAKDPKILLP